MKRILLSVSVVLSVLSVSSCDMLGDMIDKFNDVLENYEERLVLSDSEIILMFWMPLKPIRMRYLPWRIWGRISRRQ